MGLPFTPAALRAASSLQALLLSLALVAVFALGLLVSTTSSAQRPSLLDSLTPSAALPAAHVRQLRRAIASTAAASAARLAALNAAFDPAAERESGRYRLGALGLDEYSGELEGNWTKLVGGSAKAAELEWVARRVLNRLELAAAPAQQGEVPLPQTVWSTAPAADEPIPQFAHWKFHNPAWDVRKLDDDDLVKWVRRAFGEGSEVASRFERLPLKVLQSDAFRYLVLLVEGGAYGDSDTTAVKPIERWGEGFTDATDPALAAHQDSLANLWSLHDASLPPAAGRARLPPPALIISPELASSHGQHDDPQPWWVANQFARRIQITQWAIAAQPGHPVFWDTLSRVFAVQDGIDRGAVERNEVGVLEWTGPGVFTDAVMRYLRGRWGFDYDALVTLTEPIRVGDVLILPDRAFQAYASEPSEVEANSPQACV